MTAIDSGETANESALRRRRPTASAQKLTFISRLQTSERDVCALRILDQLGSHVVVELATALLNNKRVDDALRLVFRQLLDDAARRWRRRRFGIVRRLHVRENVGDEPCEREMSTIVLGCKPRSAFGRPAKAAKRLTIGDFVVRRRETKHFARRRLLDLAAEDHARHELVARRLARPRHPVAPVLLETAEEAAAMKRADSLELLLHEAACAEEGAIVVLAIARRLAGDAAREHFRLRFYAKAEINQSLRRSSE